MVIGDDDVDPAGSLATAISATLVVPQSTVTMTVAPDRDGRVDRRQRQPVALVEAARHVRLDRDAEAAQGEGHDRQTGQAVGIEVAEDQDPLAAVARERAGGRAAMAGVGQQRRVVEAVERLGEPGVEVLAGRPRRGRRAGSPGAPTGRAPRRRSGRVGWQRHRPRGRSSGSGVRPRRQDATRGCTAALPATRRVGGSGRRAPDPRGCASSSMRPCRRSSQSCQSTRSGAATKIDE